MLTDASSLATYFHGSGLRTMELKQVCAERGIKFKQLPQLFQVRFSEFSFDLLDNVLDMLEPMLNYFADARFNEDTRSKAQR